MRKKPLRAGTGLAALLQFVIAPAWAATPQQAAAWREDLAYPPREMPKRHKSFYDHTSPAEFQAAVAALDRRVPEVGFDGEAHIKRLLAMKSDAK